jgi:hypothetical protein
MTDYITKYLEDNGVEVLSLLVSERGDELIVTLVYSVKEEKASISFGVDKDLKENDHDLVTILSEIAAGECLV